MEESPRVTKPSVSLKRGTGPTDARSRNTPKNAPVDENAKIFPSFMLTKIRPDPSFGWSNPWTPRWSEKWQTVPSGRCGALPRRTSPPVTASIDALVPVTFVDAPDNLGGNMSRLGGLVFFSHLVERDVARRLAVFFSAARASSSGRSSRGRCRGPSQKPRPYVSEHSRRQ